MGKFINFPTEDIPVVYEIRNVRNGKAYIGQTRYFKQRLFNHLSNLRSHRHVSWEMQADWDNGDAFLVEVLYECPPNVPLNRQSDRLRVAEYGFIKNLQSDIDGYNLRAEKPYVMKLHERNLYNY